MKRVPVQLRGRDAPGSARRLRDIVLVGALTAATMVSLPFLDEGSAADRTVGVPAYLLVAVAGLATLARRTWPVPAQLVASAATGTYLALAYPYSLVFGFVVVTVYTTARALPVTRALPCSLVTYLMLLAHLATNEAALSGAMGAVPAAAWVAIPFTAGTARRSVVAAGERERAAAARQAADAERLRLSQEVHDVVGHGLAAIQMQADIALHVERQRPEQTRSALEAISRVSADALDDLRETLRTTAPSRPGDYAPTAPTPGLGRAQELCDRVADSGLHVELTVTGPTRPLTTAADVVAYRLLQEALTNVVKHSAQPRAEVRITHTEESVTLQVVNPELAATTVAPGMGITGMRRRVASVGGTLHVGPGEETDTFCVRATIPRHRRPTSPQEDT